MKIRILGRPDLSILSCLDLVKLLCLNKCFTSPHFTHLTFSSHPISSIIIILMFDCLSLFTLVTNMFPSMTKHMFKHFRERLKDVWRIQAELIRLQKDHVAIPKIVKANFDSTEILLIIYKYLILHRLYMPIFKYIYHVK